MKRITVLAVLLVLSFGLVGCGDATLGILPGPVPPTEWISAAVLWAEIDARITNPHAILALERNGYNTVPLERINNAAAELVLDPHWGPLTACEAFIVMLRRADPAAACGLTLVGPPENARYWVITADLVNGWIIIRLVDPLEQHIEDWVGCMPAGFVAM